MRSLALILICCIPTLGFAQVLVVVVSIPSITPASDPIHIAGDFQSWNPGSTAHILTYDSVLGGHTISLDSGLGTINFKFTRGSWDKVESDENGQFRPDRTLPPSDGDTVYFQILGWEDLTSGGGGGSQSTAAENVEVMDESFYIPQLDRYRRVWIYLPKGYHTSSQDYPVLYMHDGQNVFDESTSFIGEWEVDETLNRRFDEKDDEGIIVVAIDNGGIYRTPEYSPWPNATYGGGEGDAYARFLVETLKPHIDANYRTLDDRAHTGIMGSSLGGLISIYTALQYQEVFGLVGSLSPAYWFNPEIFDFADSTIKAYDTKFYQIAGSLEGSQFVSSMFDMEDTLRSAGHATKHLRSIEHSDGEHSEWYWAREFEAAYLWLYKSIVSSVAQQPELDETKIVLYPNPTEGQLTLRFSLDQSEHVRIHLLNTWNNGKRLMTEGYFGAGDHQLEIPLPTDNVVAGHYYLLFTTESSEEVLPFTWAK